MLVSLSRHQDCRRKIGMMGAVWKMLRGERQAISEVIYSSVFSFDFGTKKITGLELQTGLIGP